MLLSRYLSRPVCVYTNSRSAIYSPQETFGAENGSNILPINLLRVPTTIPPQNDLIRFSHFVPIVQIEGSALEKEKCGAEKFGVCCHEIVDKWICCSGCLQWYHDGCLGINAANYPGNVRFCCGCDQMRPYKSKE